MSIWFADPGPDAIDRLNALGTGTIDGHLGVRITEIGDDYLRGSMPVDERTRQPYGLLHGGASVVLAETLGSLAAALTVDHDVKYCVGLEVNANHLRSARSGRVTGTARPEHIGSTTQVWSIRIRDEQDRPTCIARLTVAVVPRKPVA